MIDGNALVVLGAGIMAAFNPCGVAMLPLYIVHLLAGRERRIWDGLWAGLMMTDGFLLVFLIAGAISVAFAAILGKAVVWIALIVGVGFTIIGILMLFGKNGLSFHIGGNWNGKQGTMLYWVRKSARWMRKLGGLITFATGEYLVVYWMPYIHLH